MDIPYKKYDEPNKIRCIVQTMTQRELLKDYIRRLMFEKDIKFKDVSVRSKGEISAAYVNDIIKGKSDNPSIKSVQALALVLGVTEDEIFAVARGIPFDEASKLKSRFSFLLENIDKLNPSDKEFVVRGLEGLSTQVEERIESYKKTPQFHLIDGDDSIDINAFLSAIKKEYPEYTADLIFDVLGNRNLEAYTPEQISNVQEFKDRFTKKKFNTLVTAS